jgi:Bacterial PH domain
MPEQIWRVRPVLPAAKLIGAAGIVVLALAFGRRDPVQWVLAGAAALGLAGWAARDLLVPVRLAAGPAGVTVVAGLARRRFLPWDEIERVRVDRRRRLGLAGELLEIDAGDSLHLFGPYDLGAAPEEAAAVLAAVRAGQDPSAAVR